MVDSTAGQNETIAALLRVQIGLLGRLALKEDDLLKMICKGRGDEKQLRAYSLCDGTRAQGEVARLAKLDGGNFSRTVSRWVSLGILFKIPDGDEPKLQHLYPLSAERLRTSSRSKNGNEHD